MSAKLKLTIGADQYEPADLADARRVYITVRDMSGEGASTFPEGHLYAPSGSLPAGYASGEYRISYNGRIWFGTIEIRA